MVKSAGEHWVCSVLARLGWGAALTRDGMERTDILAVRADGKRPTVEIQVKAATDAGDRSNWLLGMKAQQRALSSREWFVFVLVPAAPDAAPRAFVVPRDHVAAAAWIVHMDWLTDPAAPPGKRNTPVAQARVNVEAWEAYEGRWDLLNASAHQAGVLLPPWFRPLAMSNRVGLPPGHPWQQLLPTW